MQRAELQHLAAQMMGVAADNLIRDGALKFVTLLYGKDNTLTPCDVRAKDADDRAAWGDKLRALAPQMDAIIIIAEAWTLKPEDINLDRSVSENPRRIEAIFVTAQSEHGELMLVKTFARDAANKPVVSEGVITHWTDDTTKAVGSLGNLFGVCPVKKHCNTAETGNGV